MLDHHYINKIYEAWKDTVKTFDSTHPIFLAAQGESWKMGPDQMVDLKSMLEELAPGKVEICRGDHFFMLYNQSRGLSFNLALLPDARIESSSDNSENAADGSPATLWTDKDGKSGYITMDFGKEYIIDRYVLRHASASGRNADADIRSFSIETSMDAENWTRIDRQIVDGQVTDIDIPETSARYVKFTVDSPADDGIARIGDIEIFGRDPESMK